MADTITTGSVAQTGSKTYLVGTVSGIDTTALVDAAYAQKTAAADTIDVKISDNADKISAYQELQEIGTTLQTSLDSLRSYYGSTTTDSSIYANMMAYLGTSDSTITPSNIVSVTVDSSAEKGSYSLEVSQLATAMKTSSAAQTSKSDALGLDGSFEIGLEGGDSLSITVTSGMNLSDIAAQINADSTTSGVSASILKTGDNSYTLVLTATETGKNITYSSSSGTDIFQSLGLTDSAGTFTSIVQEAQQAIAIIDGIEVTSSSNTLEDVIEGVTISLLSASAGTTMTLEIDYDYSGLKDAISAFIDAYNSLRDFVIEQGTVSDDGAETGVLFKDTLLKSLYNQISTLLSSSFSTDAGISSLGEIGITYTDENKLEISDETALNNALLNNYSSIQQMFQTSIDTGSASVSVLRNSSSATTLEFTLDITVGEDGTISAVSANGDTDAFTINGTRLIGKTGTVYEGLTLVFTGTESTSTTVSMQQGLADLLYTTLDKYTSTTSGLLQSEVDDLNSTNDSLQTRADRIIERADAYREKLIEKYAAMEANLSAAELLLAQVKAILGTNDDD